MERMTLRRCNGIKTGFWTSHTKQELVDRLAEYEDCGVTPTEIAVIIDRYVSPKAMGEIRERARVYDAE